jgi:hypothetical protein
VINSRLQVSGRSRCSDLEQLITKGQFILGARLRAGMNSQTLGQWDRSISPNRAQGL